MWARFLQGWRIIRRAERRAPFPETDWKRSCGTAARRRFIFIIPIRIINLCQCSIPTAICRKSGSCPTICAILTGTGCFCSMKKEYLTCSSGRGCLRSTAIPSSWWRGRSRKRYIRGFPTTARRICASGRTSQKRTGKGVCANLPPARRRRSISGSFPKTALILQNALKTADYR